MGIYKDNGDYKSQNMQKATKPQANNSLFIIDSDEIYNQTTAKSSIDIDLSVIGTQSRMSYDSSDSDEDYNDLDNQRAKKSPIDMGLSLIDEPPTRLGVSTSAYPSNGLSMIDSENFNSTMLPKKKCINGERNKKRRIDSDEASGVLNYRKPAEPSSTSGLSVIDLENWDDSSNDNQFTTPQVKKSRFLSDSDDFNSTLKSFKTNCTVNNTIGIDFSNSTDNQESMEIDDVISDAEQANEELESEEEEQVKNDLSASLLNETDESEEMRFLISHFTQEQYDRYEKYKRSGFPKMKIKNIIESIAGHSVSQNVVIAMAGIAKSFVGDIIEKSLDIQDQQGGIEGPLHPRQIREAVRQLRRQGKILCSNDNYNKINKKLPNV